MSVYLGKVLHVSIPFMPLGSGDEGLGLSCWVENLYLAIIVCSVSREKLAV